MYSYAKVCKMQKFIRQIVLVFRGFLYFKFFEGRSQFVTPSEAWHDNSDIVWRKKISLNKKQCVESFNIDCLLAWEWPTNTGSSEERRLTNAQGSTEDDQWGVTTQSASDWLKQVSLLKLWVYENHICELQSEELFKGRSSQLYTQLMHAVEKRKPEKKSGHYHAQELTGMGKGSTDIAFSCVFWINTIK